MSTAGLVLVQTHGKVSEMGCAGTRFVCGAIVLLAAAGAAGAQEKMSDSSIPASRPSVQPSGGAQEHGGILGGMRAGFAQIFTAERLQIHVNGAYQASSRQDEIEVSFRTYDEQSKLLVRERFRGGAHIDVGGSLRIWRGLLFGASYTQMSRAGSATVTGTVPHPLDAGRDRTAPEQQVGLPSEERATHGYLGWRLTLRDRLDLELLAGATYFSLRRGVVVHLTPVEVVGPPFNEIGLQVDTGEHTRNGAGFNAGFDLTYRLTPATRIPQVGIGLFARFTEGSVSVPVTADTSRSVSVGGVQGGIGLRFRF